MVKYILTPTQMDAVNAKGEHILVKGIPGSGKTTVLLTKLQNIVEEDTTANILFITFNNTLQKYIKESLQNDLEEELQIELDKLNVEVYTYHKWAAKMLHKLRMYKDPVEKDTFSTFFKELKGTHRFYTDKKYQSFVEEEIAWIKEKGIKTFDEYKDIRRTGRGTALQANDRKIVYTILEAWNSYLNAKSLYMWQDYANVVNDNINLVNKNFKYDYIFIDEAQDLSQIQLITLRKVARKGIVVAADLGQKIYKTDFTWLSVGIKVQGGRTKKLSGAFRSTKEIMDLANSLLKHDSTLNPEDIEQEYDAEESGLIPGVLNADSYKFETELVAKLIKDIQAQTKADGWEPTIGVLLFESHRLDGWRKSLYYSNIQSEIIRDQYGSALTTGVKLLTMHGAKGLEFDYVIISGLNDRFPSLRNRLEDEITHTIDINRRLLYVSMTRAKENVYLTYKGKPSRYIEELDKNLYRFEVQ
ncbi:superfamily I DNA/RNA helicase [Lysinibacillus composti]|uniref:DNA 3'-5' helicase n=1 Tax=Lysinibacillus composti TaxID=720633 RepID=A0A3N9UCX9_9BACI|nr:ATP-dependent helicase [Lysinibacillus composti]MBM7609143.1 superfamily I DNA/RNA helicase [Lysinibacillus composti]RQW74200.1 ATP-dependent helicase [Lysinibacillus composti]